MDSANNHPYKMAIVNDDDFYANNHPYKVKIVEGGGIGAKVVDELPETGESGYIYLVLKEKTEEGDIYDEWIWAEKDGEFTWEHLGATNEVTITLYDSTGQNTDGAMTQKATTDELSQKLDITYVAIEGNSEPTSSTEAKYVGQLYIDTANGKQYYCADIMPGMEGEPASYTWSEIGGGIPTDATFWGQSYDATNNRVSGDIVLAQNRIISTSTPSGSSVSGIGVGTDLYLKAASNGGIIMNLQGVGQIQFTSSGITFTNNFANRYINNLKDPTSAQQAATKNYVDTHGAVAFPTETFNEIVGA